MAGDIKGKYTAASTAMTVTNLHSLASSQSWIAGWTSASVDNKTSNVDLDYLVGATFTTHASNRQAGSINIYVIASLNDTPTWPTVASGTPGTEGALSFTAAEQVNACARLLGSITVNNTASQVYAFPQTSIAQLFGYMPTHWCLFVTQNAATTTAAGFASSGSAVYYTRTINQYT
jgi:hypothetical protein